MLIAKTLTTCSCNLHCSPSISTVFNSFHFSVVAFSGSSPFLSLHMFLPSDFIFHIYGHEDVFNCMCTCACNSVMLTSSRHSSLALHTQQIPVFWCSCVSRDIFTNTKGCLNFPAFTCASLSFHSFQIQVGNKWNVSAVWPKRIVWLLKRVDCGASVAYNLNVPKSYTCKMCKTCKTSPKKHTTRATSVVSANVWTCF